MEGLFLFLLFIPVFLLFVLSNIYFIVKDLAQHHFHLPQEVTASLLGVWGILLFVVTYAVFRRPTFGKLHLTLGELEGMVHAAGGELAIAAVNACEAVESAAEAARASLTNTSASATQVLAEAEHSLAVVATKARVTLESVAGAAPCAAEVKVECAVEATCAIPAVEGANSAAPSADDAAAVGLGDGLMHGIRVFVL